MQKVLLVEDDEFISGVYSQIFSISGFEIELAKDGIEALEKVKVFHPEVIFLDIVMPRMDGIQTLVKLKSDDTTKNIPVVMLSNLPSDEKREEAMANGAASFVLKSEYKPKQLIELAKEIILQNQ